MDLAPVLDLTVLSVAVDDAERGGSSPGSRERSRTTASRSARPSARTREFTDEPRLYLITDETLPGEVITEIRDLEFVRKIELQ